MALGEEIYAYLGIFAILVLIGFGLPIPEDIPLIAAGVLASNGSIQLVPGMVVAWVGLMAGDSVVYGMGRRYGRHLVEHRRLQRLVTPQRLERVERYFDRYGVLTILVARFVPGLRGPAFLTAGIIRLPFERFLLTNGGGGLLSVPIWVGLGYYGAENMDNSEGQLATLQWGLAALVVVAIGLILAVRHFRSR